MKTPSLCKQLVAYVSFATLLGTNFSQAVELSSLASVPTDASVNINIASGTNEGTTARYYSEANQRSLTQTFIWNSDTAMTGLGLLIAPTQGSVGGQLFGSDQNYSLDIQRLDDSTIGRAVEETVITTNFTVTTSVVNASRYLYIEFDAPLGLENGTAYGFNFRPTEIIYGNAIAVDRSSIAYADGVGNQSGSVALIPVDGSYGNAGFDYAFYTTAVVPESSSSAVFLGVAAGIFIVFAMIKKRSRNIHKA